MKNLLISLTLLLLCTLSAYSQSRAIGARVGISSMEASYQHTWGAKGFAECDLGLDLHNIPGFKATALYNLIIATPDFTETGSWNIYAGAGLSCGFVDDVVKFGDNWPDLMGFMLGGVLNFGIEYNLDIPIQFSADIRPVFGWHFNLPQTDRLSDVHYDSKLGLFNYGMYGFVPSISARYIF